MNNNTSNKITIIALALVFLLPPILSWLIFSYGNVSGGKRNHGDLIDPARTLPDVTVYDIYEDNQKTLYGKWSIVFLNSGKCDESCAENLYKMRQVRVATNKYAHRLQRLLIVDEENSELYSEALTDEYKGQLLIFKDMLPSDFIEQFRLAKDEDPSEKGRLYIIDPLGNLMMSYESSADPIGIIEDLILLIKISRIG